MGIDDKQAVGADWTQSPQRGPKARARLGRWSVRPQCRADPRTVHRPALQRGQRDHSLTGGRQGEPLIVVVDTESPQQVQ